MSKLKKIAAFVCAGIIVLSAVGCSGGEKKGDAASTTTTEAVVSTAETTLENTDTSAETEVTEPEEVFVEIPSKDEDFTFEVADGKATLVCFEGEANTVVIPTTYEGNPVIAIGEGAFSECTGIKKVSIPEGVTVIGKRAFYNCQGITEIVIPEGVTEIGDLAFSVCMQLTEAVIPESVTTIGYMPFFSCNELTIKCKQGSFIDGYAQDKSLAVEYID